MLKVLWEFLKNPVYEEDENVDFKYRLQIVIKYWFIGLVGSILLVAVTATIESNLDLDTGKHAMDKLLENTPLWLVFLYGVLVAPVLEECIFRGPLVFFKNKSYFKYIFYLITISFGYIHIANFEISSTTLLLSPLLVAPQIFVGAIFGYIRIRFGLLWSMALHFGYNLLLLGPMVVLQLLDIPIE